MSSTPSLTKFNPHDVPYQFKVLTDIRANFDYGLGVHEVLLSGAVGCLREDALVETICGAVPIADIGPQDYVLTYDHLSNQYAYQSSTCAFLKDKGSLYRVIGEHGEFVASGHHRIATSHGSYLSVAEIYQGSAYEAYSGLFLKCPSGGQRSYLSDVLRYWHKLSSFLHHCAKHTSLYGPQLQQDLDIVLSCFPLRDDVLRSGLFFYKNTRERLGDLEALALKHGHIAESRDQTYKRHLLDLLERFESALGSSDLSIAPSKQMFDGIQQFLQSHLSKDCHPRLLLFFLAKLCIVLLKTECKTSDVGIPNTSILAIEKLPGEDWYWDLQVPNTNNYCGSSFVHHNSAKSLLMAHIIVTHCLFNKRARFGIGRHALPDLKATLFQKIKEHIQDDLREGIDYKLNDSTGYIRFSNGSEIISRSWADKNFMKCRSLELSGFAIEELTEHEDNEHAYKELMMRVNRLPHVPEQLMIAATNPDGPAHWAYKHFILNPTPTRHTYYSVTSDNRFLPASYVAKLKEDLDPKMVERMIYGRWVDIAGETIYYQYDSATHYIKLDYEVNDQYPVYFSFDFNVGHGKPMSVIFFQYINDTFHFFDEVVMDGARTESTMQEALERGLFKLNCNGYRACGDASGKANSANSNVSNYEIIETFLITNRIRHTMCYLKSNPPIKTRHNLVNAYLKNSEGRVRVRVYKKAKTLDEGFRLVKLKNGGQYIEDDSKPYQHITTAAGYGIHYCNLTKQGRESQTIQL